jgi:hypothetical protein
LFLLLFLLVSYSDVIAVTNTPERIQNIRPYHLAHDLVIVAWDEVPALEKPHEGYTLYRDGYIIATQLSALSYKDRSIEPGTSYIYQVSISDASGNESALSEPITVIVPDSNRPTKIKDLALSYAEIHAVRIYWKEPPYNEGPFNGYTIYRDGVPIETEYDSFIFRDDTVSPGTKYRYQV